MHSSVVDRDRDGKLGHVNPIAGCQVIHDVGPLTGPFPVAGDWPKTPEAAWDPALVPARTLAVGDAPVTLEVFADTEWNELPQLLLEQGATYRFSSRRRAARLDRRKSERDQRRQRVRQ